MPPPDQTRRHSIDPDAMPTQLAGRAAGEHDNPGLGGVVMAVQGRRILRLARHWPWTGEITTALKRLALLPDPG